MIKNLVSILNHSESQFMNKSTVIGFLGELYVKEKLIKENNLDYEIIHKGNQSNVDLIIKDAGNNLIAKIDVKTSRKKELDTIHPNWGWAIHQKTKNKITATHYICVALDEKFEVDSLFLINTNVMNELPEVYDSRFKNMTKALNISSSEDELLDLENYSLSHKLIKEGIIQKIQNESLFDLLIEK